MYKKLRPAIAMIELIFAIAIMGIVLMSAPMLIQTATSAAYVAIQQESISEAASRVNMILSYSWDENNTDESYPSTILTVTSGAPDLDKTLTMQRKGTPPISYRSFADSNGSELNATTAASFLLDPAEATPDDIDDFHNEVIHLRDISAISGRHADIDYIEKTTDINITTHISYSTDNTEEGDYQQSPITYNPFTALGGLPTDTSNIKMIEVTLRSATSVSELQKTITLRAFSCNIGSYVLEEKDF